MIVSSEKPSSLAEIALLRLRRDADTPFVLTIDQDQPYAVKTRPYGEISRRAAALAAALSDTGVRRRSRVGCYLPNSPSWVVASLAAWWSGCEVAAVGTLLPGSEAARLFELADVETVVALSAAPVLPGNFRVLSVTDEGHLEGAGEGDAGEVPDYPLPDPSAVAGIFFTSGTTGRSKGITYSHADFITAAERIAAGYARNVTYRPDPAPPHLAPGVIFNPFGHTAGYVRLAFRMWIGRASVLVPKFTVSAVRALLSRFDFDSLQLTPTMIHMLATSPEPIDLKSVKYVTSGTAPLSVATRERFEARFGIPVMQAYGMTEVGTVSQERWDDVVAGRRGPGSVGRVATGVELQIRPLDADRPEGEGEILVRTRDLPSEFVGGEKVPVDEDGWFATGDVGRYEDGILYITGRVQEKIIVGGFNVYPAEVEDAMRRSPLVDDVVVVGVADDRLGEVPVAGVVWSGEPDEDALLVELRSALAHYKVPRGFFPLDAVPLTSRDKIDRRRAGELARQALRVPDSVEV